jgi:phage baseplate assembly protein W
VSIFRRKREVVNPNNPDINLGKPIGVLVPFNADVGIFKQSFTNTQQVLSNLKNLLLTSKGERYMLPTFGTDIRTILFDNISSEDDFTSRLNSEIETAISEWMPFLTIVQLETIIPAVDPRLDDPGHAVSIKLVVKISGTNIYLPIQIFISDTGNLLIQEAIYNG